MKYEMGTNLILTQDPLITGVVLSPSDFERINKKFYTKNDVLVEWSTGQSSTYDEEWIDEFTTVKDRK